ncbi:MAG TPA: DUF2267 domain-containing protein [Candidatus Binataceae bacterium]|nr:DUF2267 domain-containing protein [Candidatus Binataceae bacterium]
MNDKQFITAVAHRTGTDLEAAGVVTYAVFQELRERITPKEAFDVASQLPSELQVLWLDNERVDRDVRKTHETEFIARVRHFASLDSFEEAEKGVRAVFATLQEALGSPHGTEGEAWDVFSQLPKDLKRLWLSAHDATV